MEEVLRNYQEVFRDELGTVKNIEAQLHLKENGKPKFFRPRHVPLATRGAIGEGIERLVETGVVKKVEHNE